MKQETYRKISLIAYDESLPDNWKDELQTFEKYAYIYHDKDLNKDGTLKKAHYHIVIWFGKQFRHNAVESLCEECFGTKVFQPLMSDEGILRYFQHKDNSDKEPYSEGLICSSVPLSELLKSKTDEKKEADIGCYRAVKEALATIPYENYISLYTVAEYLLDNYPQYFSEFQDRAYFYKQIIDSFAFHSKI